MTHPALLEESVALFADANRWSAFVELSNARPAIITHWLTLGTASLRRRLDQYKRSGWEWVEWGAKTDTRCYLTSHGRDSLSVGFGWNYEFHLYYPGGSEEFARANEELRKPRFDGLRTLFAEESGRKHSLRSDPVGSLQFGNAVDMQPSLENVAWIAAHQREEFVRATIAKFDRILGSAELTQSIRELNAVALGDA